MCAVVRGGIYLPVFDTEIPREDMYLTGALGTAHIAVQARVAMVQHSILLVMQPGVHRDLEVICGDAVS